jgi:hypothetical protein
LYNTYTTLDTWDETYVVDLTHMDPTHMSCIIHVLCKNLFLRASESTQYVLLHVSLCGTGIPYNGGSQKFL